MRGGGGYRVTAAQRRTFWRSVLHAAWQHCVVVPLLWYFVGWPVAAWLDPSGNPAGRRAPSDPWVWARNLAVAVLCEDCLFYWAHRWLHADAARYRRWHKVHHEFHTPSSLAAEYAHPVESLLANFVPFLAGPLLTGAHMHEICLWFVVRMTKTAEAHSGYAFPLAPFSLFPSFMTTAAHHDFHHSQNRGCYGSFFRFWDVACGTVGDVAAFEAKRRRGAAEAVARDIDDGTGGLAAARNS